MTNKLKKPIIKQRLGFGRPKAEPKREVRLRWTIKAANWIEKNREWIEKKARGENDT